MTDKELLELAAKAAGTQIRIYPGLSVERGTDCVCVTKDGFNWNPLTDDGDALRLAVKLGVHIYFNDTYVDAGVRPNWGVPIEHGDDPCAAARRAIVRAAAAIASLKGKL